jgi:hydrogenase-4 transcriptional activator
LDTAAAPLLDVWREVSRHAAIEESFTGIAKIVSRSWSPGRLLVRRLDPGGSGLETVGMAPGPAVAAEAVSPCSPERRRRLLAWCRRDEIAHGTAGEDAPDPFATCVPSPLEGDALVAPLAVAGDGAAVLVLVAAPGQRLTARHRALIQSLREPVGVALENDRRLRELDALREAAEADRATLLARLGRRDLAEEIVGADAGLRVVMERVALVSRSDAPVLILGETGAGKEVVARAIRARSARANRAFMRVNCGSIAPGLIDSELFGHERGSFTGAVAARKGFFERADGGTLLLDEVGELTLAAQVRLLHVLQDGTFERVGGQQPVRVDVRIIAATHADLPAMVRRGAFREDLWYRLAVFPIIVPPLRERAGDIPALAVHLARRAATRFGLTPCAPSDDDVALLLAYDWPGNVRELTAVIDRAAILGNGRRLDVAAALGGSHVTAIMPPAEAALPSADEPAGAAERLDAATRRHIERALAVAHGRIEGPFGAALRLGVNPHTLRGRMRRLGIEWKLFRRPAARA